MNLEQRIAYWVDLGLTSYTECFKLQEQLANLRIYNKIPDVILVTQHYPEVNFGSASEHNKLSNEFKEELEQVYGKEYTSMDVKNYLNKKGIGFSTSSRGGGATIIAPGQLVYYPIVDHEKITGKSIDLTTYKNKVDKIMFEVLNYFGVPKIEIASGFNPVLKRERRDVWFNDQGKSYKIGSKGIHFSKNVAYHGFVLYTDKKGVELFKLVKPCGYEHDEVGVISAEEVLGIQLDYSLVHRKVMESIKNNFNYTTVKEVNPDILNKLINYQEAVA